MTKAEEHKMNLLKKQRDYFEKKWHFYVDNDVHLADEFFGKYYALQIAIKYLEGNKDIEDLYEMVYGGQENE